MAGKAKQKTHKGAAKRMRLTAKGKCKRMKAGRGHLLSNKNGKRKRHLRKDTYVDASIEATYRALLGG